MSGSTAAIASSGKEKRSPTVLPKSYRTGTHSRKEVNMARVFVYDGREFPDPDPSLSVDEVRSSMANFFPELSNAETKESERDSETEPGQKDAIYEFKRRVGVKG